VDLEGEDYAVLDMIKNNPKVDVEYAGGGLAFKYRSKYDIRCSLFVMYLIPLIFCVEIEKSCCE
jgi:hypothetical protein